MGGCIVKMDREKIFKKFDGHCAYCGIKIDFCNLHIDHIKSRASGCSEIDSEKNFNPACPVCNNWKHCDNLETFRRSIETQVRKCRDYSRNFRMAERYGLVNVTEKPIVFYFEYEWLIKQNKV